MQEEQVPIFTDVADKMVLQLVPLMLMPRPITHDAKITSASMVDRLRSREPTLCMSSRTNAIISTIGVPSMLFRYVFSHTVQKEPCVLRDVYQGIMQ
jgi:hypothetical protein